MVYLLQSVVMTLPLPDNKPVGLFSYFQALAFSMPVEAGIWPHCMEEG